MQLETGLVGHWDCNHCCACSNAHDIAPTHLGKCKSAESNRVVPAAAAGQTCSIHHLVVFEQPTSPCREQPRHKAPYTQTRVTVTSE
eukprot:4574315-Amphidinium_carterae.1